MPRVQQTAFFGGDPDNFEFPRYDLDVCFFRAYENGKPAKVKDFLKFSPLGPRAGDLVLVSGHPGGTSRLQTVAQLTYDRDTALPFYLGVLKRREVLLGTGAPAARKTPAALAKSISTSRTAGKLAMACSPVLLPELISARAKTEADFKSRLAGKSDFAEASKAYSTRENPQSCLGERGTSRNTFAGMINSFK